MGSTYSWSFDAMPSNKDGIPVVAWMTQDSNVDKVSGRVSPGIKTHRAATAVRTIIRHLFVRVPTC